MLIKPTVYLSDKLIKQESTTRNLIGKRNSFQESTNLKNVIVLLNESNFFYDKTTPSNFSVYLKGSLLQALKQTAVFLELEASSTNNFASPLLRFKCEKKPFIEKNNSLL